MLSALPLGARDKTDVLIMNNGDHLTCEIKSLDSGVLYVSLDYILGTSSLQWSKVARIESKQLFIVKTQDGSVALDAHLTLGELHVCQFQRQDLAGAQAVQ
jgi:hypothetical protein